MLALCSALFVTGCADSSAVDPLLAPPEQPRLGAEPHLAGPIMFKALLLPVTDPLTHDAYSGGGTLRLTFGRAAPPDHGRRIYPPGPCRSTSLLPAVQDEFVQVNVCAFIENPGGGALSGGGLVLNNDPNQRGGFVLTFGTPNLYPPGPCRSYVVLGAVATERGLATALSNRPGDFAALFEFQEVDNRPGGEIRGVFGPPSRGGVNPGSMGGVHDPDGGDPACVIDVTPARLAG
jgi:hypothetical protein